MHRRARSSLVQAIACCLMAPSHYLNQCWLIIREVFLGIHLRTISQEILKISILDMCLKITSLWLQLHLLKTNELRQSWDPKIWQGRMEKNSSRPYMQYMSDGHLNGIPVSHHYQGKMEGVCWSPQLCHYREGYLSHLTIRKHNKKSHHCHHDQEKNVPGISTACYLDKNAWKIHVGHVKGHVID